MDRHLFEDELHLDEMPLCEQCKLLFWKWAEADPRSEANLTARKEFAEHFIFCRERRKLSAAA